MILWIRFVLAVLATWRVTHLLASEDGPAEVIVRLRVRLGRSWAGRLTDCFNCLSLWIAAPAALFVSTNPLEWMFAWLALSAAACLLERLGPQPVLMQVPAPGGRDEQEGGNSDVLRTKAGGDHAGSAEAGCAGEPLYSGAGRSNKL